MADPHNPERYGETYSEEKIRLTEQALQPFKDLVILSGGWAWHYLSPVGHEELKHAHDHKDVDMFIEPGQLWELIRDLKSEGFRKEKTRHDTNEFMRYVRTEEADGKPFKIVFDIFTRTRVPARRVQGYLVTEPEYLIGLYSDIHSSGNCFAVKAADELLKQGIDPEGREELCQIPD